MSITPMMQQWRSCKEQAKDAILLFRLGDFYEAFCEDAAVVAEALQIALTKRQEIPMSGIPYHACNSYIDKLLDKGYRVAIAEQMEDPKQAKGLVERKIVRILSPGAVIDSQLIRDKEHNFIVSFYIWKETYGVARLDLTTGTFIAGEFSSARVALLSIERAEAVECILVEGENTPDLQIPIHHISKSFFDLQTGKAFLCQHFDTKILDGFGLDNAPAATIAAAGLLRYVSQELKQHIGHVHSLKRETLSQHMQIDKAVQNHLQLISRDRSLLSILDYTTTPMGGRLLGKWLKAPLLDIALIEQRQNAIGELLARSASLTSLYRCLQRIRDLERLTTRLSSQVATPRDLLSLGNSLSQLPSLALLLAPFSSSLLSLPDDTPLQPIAEEIDKALVTDPPVRLGEGIAFAANYHKPLDELRSTKEDNTQFLATYEQQLKKQLGIKSLRISYNKAFGYSIEVGRNQGNLMPDHFQKRQTLTHSERFTSPELQQREQAILGADEQIVALEKELFEKLRRNICCQIPLISATAAAVAQIDALRSLASAAHKHKYAKPIVDRSKALHIELGRHPILAALDHEEHFIPNNTQMDEESQMMLITGPNMAGKSTYIRQVALIAIMAHIGSYVPARKAHIGLIDRIFSRMGASDDIALGRSTFMVEMVETAHILHHATDRSLVLLDEIGRGTSTHDGISIAWAVAEYLVTEPTNRAKTMFATHYPELNALADTHSSIKLYNIDITEIEDQIIFLHKIIPGGSNRSYGIQVAKLAGLPQKVIARAQAKLAEIGNA